VSINPLEPTSYNPGSEGKIRVLEARAALELPLFLEGDAVVCVLHAGHQSHAILHFGEIGFLGVPQISHDQLEDSVGLSITPPSLLPHFDNHIAMTRLVRLAPASQHAVFRQGVEGV